MIKLVGDMNKCKICGEKVIAKGYCPKHYQEKFRHDRYLRYKDREMIESKQRSRFKRQKLLKELNFLGRCQKCNVEIDTSQKRSVFIVGDKVICFPCWNERRKLEGFSRDYDMCIRCGSKNGKHAGLGLCASCYSETRNRENY